VEERGFLGVSGFGISGKIVGRFMSPFTGQTVKGSGGILFQRGI
jgi:hypothetical protein